MDEMHIVSIALAAVFGAVLGSFINVLAIRWHDGASIGGRSACMSCKTRLKARHLVPIVSWLFLRGRCAACRAKIHPQYVLVETAAAVLFAVAAYRWDPSNSAQTWHFAFEALMSIGLLVPLIMDLRWQEIPVEYVLGLGCIGLIFRSVIAAAAFGWGAPVSVLAWTGVAVAGATVFFGGQILLSRGSWLGSGDLWLGIGMAGILGSRDLAIAVYLAYIVGGLAAMAGLAAGLVKRRSRLPFAPALVVGTMCAIWFGDIIAVWVRHAFI